MLKKCLTALLLVLPALFAVPAAAQDKPMKLQSTVQLVRSTGNGELRLEEARSVVPGDTLRFTTRFRNESASPVRDFVIVNPVPKDLLLSDEGGAQTEVSVDGGHHWGRLPELVVVTANNKERPATAEDITHMRWTFEEIPPGETGQVQFSAAVR